jgi:hypothetical protein
VQKKDQKQGRGQKMGQKGERNGFPALGARQDRTSTPDTVRTCNLRFRRPMLYPIELRVQSFTV